MLYATMAKTTGDLELLRADDDELLAGDELLGDDELLAGDELLGDDDVLLPPQAARPRHSRVVATTTNFLFIVPLRSLLRQ
jgi:hypothetical protein